MRVCSFVPAATQMIYDLGLEEHLVGVTFECPSDKRRVVRSRLEGQHLDSAAVDAVVRAAVANGESLYEIDQTLLERADPEVVFTQHVCDVCQIGTTHVERALYTLAQKRPRPPKVVPLVPQRLDDVFANAVTIAGELGALSSGEAFVAAARRRLDAVTDTLQAAGAVPRRILLLEWMDPLYNCGHWIPDQIRAAGGIDELSSPGQHSTRLDDATVRVADPEVLVVAPCGFDVARGHAELPRLLERPGFRELSAVKSGRSFVVSGTFFTQPSLSELLTGVELLASLLHPTLLSAPARANGAWRPF